MTDSPTTVNGIGLALTLDTSQFDAALARSERKRQAFVSAGGAGMVTVPLRRGAGTVGTSAYLPQGGGTARGGAITVSPQLTAGNTAVFRTQLRRDLAAAPIPITVTLGRGRYAQMRRDISDQIGPVPIQVTYGGQKGGTLDVVTAIVARASGISKVSALQQIRSSMAATGTDTRTLEKRATGGPVSSRRPTLVGERGPEVITPTSSGSITPANELARIRREMRLLHEERRRWSGGRAAAYNQTIDSGGGTFDLGGHQPHRGYAVALGNGPIIDERDRVGFIRGFRGVSHQVGQGLAPYVGTWLHDQHVYIDPATVVRTQHEANAIGRMTKQLAYYDLLKKRELQVKAYGGNVFGLRGMFFGGKAKKPDPQALYKQRLEHLRDLRFGAGTQEERLAWLHGAAEVAPILGVPMLPEETTAEGGSKRHLSAVIQEMLRGENDTPGIGSDEAIRAAMARLPKVMHEPGVSRRAIEARAIHQAVPETHPIFPLPGRLEQYPIPKTKWSKSQLDQFGFSQNAMGGMVKPISYGPGFAHSAQGGRATHLAPGDMDAIADWLRSYETTQSIQDHPESKKAQSFLSGLRKSPLAAPIQYRGVAGPGRSGEESLAYLKERIGKRLTFSEPQSASPNPIIGASYAEPTLYRIKTPAARDLTWAMKMLGEPKFAESVLAAGKYRLTDVQSKVMRDTFFDKKHKRRVVLADLEDETEGTPEERGFWLPKKAQGGPAHRGGLPRGYAIDFMVPNEGQDMPWHSLARTNPDRVRAILKKLDKPEPFSPAMMALVRKGEDIVGSAPFTFNMDEQAWHPEMTFVDEAHRRKGLATAMYSKLERFTGHPVMPSDTQTQWGRSLWAQTRRAFGKVFEPSGDRRDRPAPEPADNLTLDGLLHLSSHGRYRDAGPMRYSFTTEDDWHSFTKDKDDAHRAAGGGALKGAYIVNENGRELFVPKRLQDRIPADVMSQIAHRDKGGITEINQQPWSLFFPPEDGWIVPAHLKNRVPRAESGTEVSPGEEFRRREEERKRIEREKQERAARRAAGEKVGPAPKPRTKLGPKKELADLSDADYLKAAKSQQSFDALIRRHVAAPAAELGESIRSELEQGRLLSAGALNELSGSSGRAQAGRLFGSRLGRRTAVQNQQRLAIAGRDLAAFTKREQVFLTPESEEIGRKARDASIAQGERLEKAQKDLQEKNKGLLDQGLPASSAAYQANAVKIRQLNIDITNQSRVTKKATERYEQIVATQEKYGQLQGAFQKAQSEAQPGLVARAGVFGGVVAGNIAFQVLSQAAGLLVAGLKPGLFRLYESATGFYANEQRVTKGLADNLGQMGGRINQVFATAGGAAGLSTQSTDYLQSLLAPSVVAKAAAANETQAGDLVRAGLGSGQSPTGLYGSYGGLFGSGILAEGLGGGRGLVEQLGEEFRDLGNSISLGTPKVDYGLQALQGSTSPFSVQNLQAAPAQNLVGYAYGQLGAGTGFAQPTPDQIATAAKAQKLLTQRVDDLNRNFETGTRALYENSDGLKLVQTTDTKLTKAMLDAAQATGDQNAITAATQFAGAGVALTANGNAITSPDQFQKYFENYAKGLTTLSSAQFLRQQASDRDASRLQSAMATRFQSEVALPYQFGAQYAANPILPGSVGAGLKLPTGAQASGFFGAGGSQFAAGIQSQFSTAQTDLSALQAQSIKWINDTRNFIATNVTNEAGNEFAGYMDQVTQSGQKIAGAELAIAKTQASLNFAQTANNLRLASRGVADALGLLGKSGGSNYGQLEREQTLLGFNLQQRQINLSTAVAGFQNPGETPEERAARQQAAQAEAKIAQQQLNIGEAQFKVSAQRALTDANATIDLLHQSQRTEATVLANQATIQAEQAKQQQAMSHADAIYQEAAANAQTDIGLLTSYVKQFGREAAAADGIINIFAQDFDKISLSIEQILGITRNTDSQRYGAKGNLNAGGTYFSTTGATTMTVGEAGRETVAVLRNPRAVQLGAMSTSGTSGTATVVFNLAINNPVVRKDDDIVTLARTVRDEIDRALRLAGLR